MATSVSELLYPCYFTLLYVSCFCPSLFGVLVKDKCRCRVAVVFHCQSAGESNSLVVSQFVTAHDVIASRCAALPSLIRRRPELYMLFLRRFVQLSGASFDHSLVPFVGVVGVE